MTTAILPFIARHDRLRPSTCPCDACTARRNLPYRTIAQLDSYHWLVEVHGERRIVSVPAI